MSLSEIYARMILFVEEAGSRHPKIAALVEPLTKTNNIDVFLSIFGRQPQVQPLIDACKTGTDDDRKRIVMLLIDQMLMDHGIVRSVDLIDATADIDKISRYLVLWCDIISCR
jgi:hypothetical protein